MSAVADDFASLLCPMPDCLSPLHLAWTCSRPLYLGDLAAPAPIAPEEADFGFWTVKCEEGHVVLVPADPGCQREEGCAGNCSCDVDHDDELRTFRASDVTRLHKLLARLGGGS
ncbi:hypothetical protein [Actinoplanes siamensis]|uniref:Uncharacterized protein n=1 Tax=Actinoplanes siamensis TaxID=1223317 RepID=A0A919TP98_9ACTN|nr:hypothetical protein [Actinoplanes siamensis]GIF08695.1 hypothetical protein Asi03nite_62330 [Actinoplanes siamensis]